MTQAETIARLRERLAEVEPIVRSLRKLTELARGKPCQFRFPGVCNSDPATSVWAHVNRGGISGVGQKAPDICGGIACSACHDVIDGRDHAFSIAEAVVDSYILEGVLRSQALVWREVGL